MESGFIDLRQIIHYAKNVSGTNAYWDCAKDDFKKIITQVGDPLPLNFITSLVAMVEPQILNIEQM